jgi:hypothetical protein
MEELTAADKVTLIRWLVSHSFSLRQASEGLLASLEELRALQQIPALSTLDESDPLGRQILEVIEATGGGLKAMTEAFKPVNGLLRSFAQDAEAVALYHEQTGEELSIEELPGVM